MKIPYPFDLLFFLFTLGLFVAGVTWALLQATSPTRQKKRLDKDGVTPDQ